MRLLRHPLACSWRSLSTCNTTTVVALSLHRRARRTSSCFRLSLLVFWLSFASRFRDDSRLCRRSALSGLVSDLVSGLLSSLPPLCSFLCRLSVLISVSLLSISASATPLAHCVALYSTVSQVTTTVFREKLSQKTFCNPPQ